MATAYPYRIKYGFILGFERFIGEGWNEAGPPPLGRSDIAPACLERVMGIEPTYAAWEAAVLPLNYTRILALLA